MTTEQNMNESQALKDVENSLRDFISIILWNKHKEDWIQNCGVTPKRIEQWENKKAEEIKKLQSSVAEERLIYYSDFYDLETIIEKNWETDFKVVFDDRSTFRVFFKQLEHFRNPEAHRRELLTYQKHLIIGIAGHIRNKIVVYRSKMETDDDVFPRIESIRDNYGNIWIPGKGHISTETLLHPGDILEFIITATDPLGGKLYYGLHPSQNWQESNILTIKIEEQHIGKPKTFLPMIKSERNYHADGHLDAVVSFDYPIRPNKIVK